MIMMMQRTQKHCGSQERISCRLAVMTYQSIHGTSPSYLQSCFTRVADDSCALLLHVVCTFRPFVSVQSASGRFRFLVPPSGTTCLSTSHLCRHSRSPDNDSRPFCFPIHTKTLSYDYSCVTITIYHYSLDTCCHCHN